MSHIDYDALDPGIRDVVRTLRTAGYTTTDSGDGVSKFDPESPFYAPDSGALRVPHVVVPLELGGWRLIEAAQIVQSILRRHGESWQVELSYRPCGDVAYLFCSDEIEDAHGDVWCSHTGNLIASKS